MGKPTRRNSATKSLQQGDSANRKKSTGRGTTRRTIQGKDSLERKAGATRNIRHAGGGACSVPSCVGRLLPDGSSDRKAIPLARGCADYFSAALIEVARLSLAGNRQHGHEDSDLHWERGKSSDHADCLLRHFFERGTVDTDGALHSVKVAWRALALAQEELEALGAPLARGARIY